MNWTIRLVLLAASAIAASAGGCAYAPKVSHVVPADEGVPYGATLKGDVVFYALPRSLIVVTLPMNVHHFRPGLIESLPGDVLKCKDMAERLDPGKSCYWEFKSARPQSTEFVAQCDRGEFLALADSPVLEVVPQPDPSQIYAVELAAAPLSRLKVDLSLSSVGSPTEFFAEATTPVADRAKLTSDLIGKSSLKQSSEYFQPTAPEKPPDPLQDLHKVVAALARIELEKHEVILKNEASGDVLAAMDEWQAELRRIVEGAVQSEPVTVRLAFEPRSRAVTMNESEAKCDAASVTCEWEKVPPQTVPNPLGCSSAADKVLKFGLLLDAHSNAKQFARSLQAAVRPKGSSAGLFYRTPVYAAAKLFVVGSGTGIGREKAKPLSGTLAIPQWGYVHALPRRLGFGSGSIGASLDPATGALTKVSSVQDNTAASELLGLALARATPAAQVDPAAAEKERLEVQVAICAARHQLGLPSIAECASYVPAE